MSNVEVIPAPPPGRTPDHLRRTVGGSICPTCRLSADLGITHVCITNGGDELDRLMIAATDEQWLALLDALAAHPARPRGNGTFTLRPANSTWCYCSCDTRATR